MCRTCDDMDEVIELADRVQADHPIDAAIDELVQRVKELAEARKDEVASSSWDNY